MKYLLIKLVHVYQVILSPLLHPSCRFYPTCSQYVIDAIAKRGVLIGVINGVRRVLSCHPFGGSGYDPVK